MKGKGEELLQRVGKAALRETEEKGDSQWVVRDPQTGAESVGSREGGRGAGWTCCPSLPCRRAQGGGTCRAGGGRRCCPVSECKRKVL